MAVHRLQARDSKADDQEFLLSIAFSPDGKSVACASMKGTVYIFDMQTQQQKCALTGHFKPIRSLAFTPGANSAAFHLFVFDISATETKLGRVRTYCGVRIQGSQGRFEPCSNFVSTET